MCPGRPCRAAWLLAPLLLAACTAPATPAVSARTRERERPVQDAVPAVYGEQEVDVPARPLEPVRPAYPPRLRQLGIEGSVEARVVVWPDGSVHGGELLASDHPEFTRAVREALAEARFAPGMRRGVPVASKVTLRLNFRLDR